MSFHLRLQNKLNELNISQAELAKQIGKNKSSVSQYLSGKNKPNANTLDRICEVLNCDKEYLLDETQEVIKFEKKVPPKIAAQLLGTSERFIQLALQQGTAPFGFAVRGKKKNGGDCYSYHISPKQLAEYIGKEI